MKKHPTFNDLLPGDVVMYVRAIHDRDNTILLSISTSYMVISNVTDMASVRIPHRWLTLLRLSSDLAPGAYRVGAIERHRMYADEMLPHTANNWTEIIRSQ